MHVPPRASSRLAVSARIISCRRVSDEIALKSRYFLKTNGRTRDETFRFCCSKSSGAEKTGSLMMRPLSQAKRSQSRPCV